MGYNEKCNKQGIINNNPRFSIDISDIVMIYKNIIIAFPCLIPENSYTGIKAKNMISKRKNIFEDLIGRALHQFRITPIIKP